MATLDQAQEEIIGKVIENIQQKLPKKQSKLIIDFASKFLRHASPEDLSTKAELDLYGSVLSHWELIKNRKPGQSKIRIYNPYFEEHGWQSTHTIIEIINDDMPFLVDSLRMEINRLGYALHKIIHLGNLRAKRNKAGNLVELMDSAAATEGVQAEAPIYIEIDRQTQPEKLQELQENLEHILKDVKVTVQDWSVMRAKIRDALKDIDSSKKHLDTEDVSEAKDFLQWMENDHFTFLGYRYYDVVGEGEKQALKLIPESSLGVLRDTSKSKTFRSFSALPEGARKFMLSKNILITTKTNTRSSVHRSAYTDLVVVKVFNEQGQPCGEHRFIGLYTSSAYNSNPRYIPVIRRKVASIVKRSNLSLTGHAGKALLNIFETLPRDLLFQASVDELAELATGIMHLQERKRIRLFARKDIYGRFVSCLVYVPRERFTTELASQMQDILLKAFQGLEISYTTRFSDSILARIHFQIRKDSAVEVDFDLEKIEQQLVEIAKDWRDELKEILQEHYGEEKAIQLFNKYRKGFPAGYRETFIPRTAVCDIEHVEALEAGLPLTMGFYRPLEDDADTLRFKLFRLHEAIPLSDALPIFEDMGLRVLGERPYEIVTQTGTSAWINDFSVVSARDVAFDIQAIKDIFQETFFRVWAGDAEDDAFNSLVLTARLNWREISILRAYTKYFRQTEFTYSQSYIEETVTKYPVLSRMIVHLFTLRFDPKNSDQEAASKLEAKITNELDNIAVLDEDRIMRRFLDVIKATLRTNYFQQVNGEAKCYLSFKLDPEKVPELPLPLPMYEIFVYSPRLEGVHLRSSKVARGGLRWSDRREDFRTEILGLMKAQNVKNAVIVPSGAKGGFVCKCLPEGGSREAVMEEVIHCYRTFIKGLLDITDNLMEGDVVPPKDTVRYDDDDTYLVVAADKGTATFSDIANSIASEYKFWLDDAFASGGCTGYDHKKMGITARGAWESVKRLFRELAHDTQSKPFQVVGIGDMAGDVFGNGMLLSDQIKLVGAFNHMHIFLDPDPDPKVSFEERKRLFHLPRSSWTDYDERLISEGGGIYPRNAKAIKLTPQIKKLLGIKKDFIVPNELLRCMLTAEVDLLWNGGIGTFVKASSETHTDAGDRTNDAIRINGEDLRCKVVGEGGNLGLTQLARVEYALNGGHIFTDFIDNSAGVDCSDHEVNLKILLNAIVSNGDMTSKQRNQLLADMTDDVANIVLDNNYQLTKAISITATHSATYVDLHNRFIHQMVSEKLIDAELEFLPSEQELFERKTVGKGLTRPEIAILYAYNKSILKGQILDSDVPEDPYLSAALSLAFPKVIREKYHQAMQKHSLSREIIATLLSNAVVNEMGFTFVNQLHQETGAPVSAIVRAYTITRNIFKFSEVRIASEKLDYKVSSEILDQIIYNYARVVRRATRWLLRNRRTHLDITSLCEHFGPCIDTLSKRLEIVLSGAEKEKFIELKQYYTEAGVPESLAQVVAGERGLISILDIIDSANQNNFKLEDVASTYFALGEHLDIGWFRAVLNAHPIENQWEALAKQACRDDLDWQQRGLTIAVLQSQSQEKKLENKLNSWLEQHHALIERWHHMLASLKASTSLNYTMFTVAVRELMDLTQTSQHLSKKIEHDEKIAEASEKKLKKAIKTAVE